MSNDISFPISSCTPQDVNNLITEIPEPPHRLYVRGTLPKQNTKYLAVVGSRNYSDYAVQTIDYLIGGLAGYHISIISGLAIGVDTLAHRTALNARLHTIAVPGSGIHDSVIYPSRNKALARTILENGGALVSEFEPTFRATQWSFPKRNRIMAGLSHATLLIEASEKSGTLITARLATDFNRELLVVPGNIFSDNSKGLHQFLKLGAVPITTPQDIVDTLQLEKSSNKESVSTLLSERERLVCDILSEPKDQDEIIRSLPFNQSEAVALLMQMELTGIIAERNGIYHKII